MNTRCYGKLAPRREPSRLHGFPGSRRRQSPLPLLLHTARAASSAGGAAAAKGLKLLFFLQLSVCMTEDFCLFFSFEMDQTTPGDVSISRCVMIGGIVAPDSAWKTSSSRNSRDENHRENSPTSPHLVITLGGVNASSCLAD